MHQQAVVKCNKGISIIIKVIVKRFYGAKQEFSIFCLFLSCVTEDIKEAKKRINEEA